jgi:hypothetical protein
MNPLLQLDQLRQQMAEELMDIPQYRALKAMESLIADLTTIYDPQPLPEPVPQPVVQERQEPNKRIAQAIENSLKRDAGSSIVKNGSYLPVNRVA